jgi:hypothetical protein
MQMQVGLRQAIARKRSPIYSENVTITNVGFTTA